MPELQTRLRELIDRSAPPITLEEIRERVRLDQAHHRPAPSRRRFPAALVTALLAVAVVVGIAVTATIVLRDKDTQITTQSPSSSPRGRSSDCVKTETNLGCDRSIPEAEQMLRISIRAPRHLPDGWMLVHRVVRVFPAGSLSNPGPDEIADYSQVWAPGGNPPFAENTPHPDYLQLLERAALPSEDGQCSLEQYPLADGSVACGSIGPATFGSGDGPIDDTATLDWVSEGVSYRVRAVGLAPAEVLKILNSLE
jgi:hypothetical protein